MKKSRKEFINKLHLSATKPWKTKIEEEFPKLFKKEEKANGWYKDTIRHKWCMFFENGIMKYGVDMLGKWKENLSHNYTLGVNDYKATNKEVGETLIKEAKKKGFDKEGISFKIIEGSSTGNVNLTKITNQYVIEYESSRNRVVLVKNSISYTICINGKWAEIIKETIVKDVLEAGKWYKSSHGCIFKYNGVKDCENDPCGYGFSNNRAWFKGSLIGWIGTYTPATNEEVEQAHIKEAKRIGYKGGDNIGNFNGCGKEILYNSNYNFSTNSGLFYVGGCCVCEKGEWATIVENITRKQAEKELGKVITD